MGELYQDPRYAGRTRVFADREEAGRVLARLLAPAFAGRRDAVVLAIPAGGVPVGLALARELGLPLDLVFVRKLHFPENPEAGFGAVTEGGAVFVDPRLAEGLPEEVVARVVEAERRALAERVRRLRRGAPPRLRGKTAILTDDGLATGSTMLAAVDEARRRGARELVVAVPTASLSAVQRILPQVDALYVVNLRGGPFFAVADAYRNWRDLSLEEVAELLGAATEEALEHQKEDADDHEGVGEVEDRP